MENNFYPSQPGRKFLQKIINNLKKNHNSGLTLLLRAVSEAYSVDGMFHACLPEQSTKLKVESSRTRRFPNYHCLALYVHQLEGGMLPCVCMWQWEYG